MWNTVPQERFPLASRSIVAIISIPAQRIHQQAINRPAGPSQSEFTVAPKKKKPDKQRVYGPTVISSQCAQKPCFLGRTPAPRHQTTILFKTILTSEENQANSGTPHIRSRGVLAILSAAS